jgi:AraC-like DNA-binding protein
MGQFATNDLFAHMPIIRDIIYGAASEGADLQALCSAIDLQPSDLNQTERKVPFEQAYRAWEVAVSATTDKYLGLKLGRRTGPLILGLVGHLMQSSSNLREAFLQVVSYNELFTNIFRYRLTPSGNLIQLSFEPLPLWQRKSELSAQQAVDQAMAGTLSVFEMLCGKKIVPTRVEMICKRPRQATEYTNVFQCSIQFNAPSNALFFEAETLLTPVLSYDRSLFKTFDALLKKKRIAQNGSFRDKIFNLIVNEFMGQAPSIDLIASHLSLTVRSLQRKLAEEGASYRTLVAAWQTEMATTLLASPSNKISEVARLLGYSEASSFRRAFKKRTDQLPSRKRK